MPGDEIVLGKKPTGTLVTDALKPGQRLFMLSTGTGLAPFLSLIRDPDVYDMYSSIVVVHSVRRVSDLAFRTTLESHLSGDPLVEDQAAAQFTYVPTVTREEFHTTGRIDALVDNGTLFSARIGGAQAFDPAADRIMLCGSTEMIRDFSEYLEGLGFEEGSNAKPGDYVIERAFVG